MMDVLNDQLIRDGQDPVAFDHDCSREGICGMCSMFINGEAHGPNRKTTTCQLHMRSFKDGETIYIEPLEGGGFPGGQGLGRGPWCIRPHHTGRWLREREQLWKSTGWKRDTHSKASCG